MSGGRINSFWFGFLRKGICGVIFWGVVKMGIIFVVLFLSVDNNGCEIDFY